jgi:short-subunit dehydrogenase
MNIQEKVVIVTGASAGIGEATAKLLAKKGAKVVLAARSSEKIAALSKELPGSISIPTDMTDEASIQHLIDETKKRLGRVDILINNAGQGLYGPIETVSVSDYRKIFELNVVGPLVAMQKVIPVMREDGGGMIINISSMLSKMYVPYLGGYASTKYALNALSLTARQELEKDKIIVSVMLPGLTATEFGKNAIKSGESFTRPGGASMPQADSAEHVADRILLAIENEKAEVYAHDEMKRS